MPANGGAARPTWTCQLAKISFRGDSEREKIATDANVKCKRQTGRKQAQQVHGAKQLKRCAEPRLEGEIFSAAEAEARNFACERAVLVACQGGNVEWIFWDAQLFFFIFNLILVHTPYIYRISISPIDRYLANQATHKTTLGTH